MAEDEVLGQDEIDSLLGALSEEEEADTAEPAADAGGGAAPVEDTESATTTEPDIEDRDVKEYNFKRPDKFSKDQIRTLQMIHESFARTTTTDLSAQLRSLASLTVASVDQLSYEEFMKVVPSPTTLGIIDMEPLEGKAIFEMDPALVFEIVDHLFGGGEGTRSPDIERELTDIEHSVIERIFMSILNNLRDSWEDVLDLHPRLEQIESNPQFVQIIPPNDMVVLITFDTKIGDTEGMTNLCIPYVILGPVINKLSATFWYGSSAHELSEEQVEELRNKINYVRVPISVEVGKAQIDVRDYVELEEGDVIKLDTSMDDPFELKVNGKPKFDCKPGYRGKKIAVQVIEPKTQDEFIDSIMNDVKKEIRNGNADFESEAIDSAGRR